MRKTFQKWRAWRYRSKAALEFTAHAFEGRPTIDGGSEKLLRRRKVIAHYLYNFMFSLLSALILSQAERSPLQEYDLKVGDLAPASIESPITVELKSLGIHNPLPQELEHNTPPVFDYDDSTTENWIARWTLAIKKVRLEFYSNKKKPVPIEQVAIRIQLLTNQTLAQPDLLILHRHQFSEETEKTVTELGTTILGKVISGRSLFPTYSSTGITMRLVSRDLRERNIYDVSQFWTLDQARDFIRRAAKDSKQLEIARIIAEQLTPNLRFNEKLTKTKIAIALAGAAQAPRHLKKGQVIVSKGELVTKEQAQVLSKLEELTSGGARLKKFALSLLLLFVFFSVLFRLNITGRAFWNLSLKDALIFLGITLFSFAAAKFALPHFRTIFANVNMGFGVEYLLPVSAGGIIIHLMMGKETAFTYATLTSIVVGYVLDQNFYFTVYSFAVCASAIQSIRSCKQRTDLYRSGAWSGLVGALLVLCFSLTQSLGIRSIEMGNLLLAIALAFSSGMISAILTSALIPVFETLIGYTTSLKLLELSNFNHPLLHSLMMKAPGTYHHSVIVGSLAELAADRIKANSLLSRVSSYYHDIGKMTKPLYFIENQAPNSNPHNHLQPSMSAKILFAHVKDGVKLGKEHSLGSSIVNIIEQHHGTTLVSYFYAKAKKTEVPEHDIVEESQFRYPGPKPQTREAAIVMLADACEAATRSIAAPSASKIQNMVHTIITRRFMEEQFSECELTLRDLKLVEECFVRTLVSLYHHRIEYPGQQQPPVTAVPPAGPDKKRSGHSG